MKRAAVVAVATSVAACTLAVDTANLSGGATDAGDAAVPVLDGGPLHPEAGNVLPDGATEPPPCNVPTESDPKNCGACGKDCLGGTCTNGRCGVGYIATGLRSPLGVGAAAGKVYVGDDDGLSELDLDGRNRRVVVPDAKVQYVHATESEVLFTSGGAIRRWPRSGGDAATILDEGSLGLALSPTHLYYTRYTTPASGGGVYRVTYPEVGTPQRLFEYDHPEEIDWLDGRLYVGSDGESDAVISVKDDGTGTRTTLLEDGGPVGVGVLGAEAFIARQGGGEVLRVPAGGGSATSLAKGLGRPSGIVATATAVYWAEVGSGKLAVLVR